MKNSSFMEFIIFFAFIGFIGTMMNMEADLKDSTSMESNTKFFVLEEHIEWENRLERLSPVGIVAHDSKPETNLFEIVLTATFQDVNNDDLTYSWEHLNSWDNGADRNSFSSPITFTPNSTSSKVECQVVAGIHEFQVTVTDTYGEESVEIVAIEVGEEQNVGPSGRVSVVKRVPGCMDKKAQNFNSLANSDDGTCQYPGCTDSKATNYDSGANVDNGTCVYPPVDPFGGDVEKIKDFQSANGLNPDGQWGPASQTKYDEVQSQPKVEEVEEEVNEEVEEEKIEE